MDGKLRNMTSIYILDGDKMLLLYRIGSRVVAPSWCGIGGHFEKDELNDAGACLLRELYEEIGLRAEDLSDLRMRYVTLRMKNGEIRQNYYFFANLKEGVTVQEGCNEGILKWVPLNEIQGLPMPFTAEYVLRHYLETGHYTEAVYGGIACSDGVRFVELSEF